MERRISARQKDSRVHANVGSAAIVLMGFGYRNRIGIQTQRKSFTLSEKKLRSTDGNFLQVHRVDPDALSGIDMVKNHIAFPPMLRVSSLGAILFSDHIS